MKILLACEGQSEVYLMKGLISRGYLTFDCPLLMEEPIHLRQISEIAPIINSLPVDEEIIIYRIGDTLNDSLSMDKFKMRINYIKSYKFCTKTEVEILVVINEGLLPEYKKVSKIIKPKSFIREHIPNFDPADYFLVNDMLGALTEYKRIKKHKKDELFLVDLLNVKKTKA